MENMGKNIIKKMNLNDLAISAITSSNILFVLSTDARKPMESVQLHSNHSMMA